MKIIDRKALLAALIMANANGVLASEGMGFPGDDGKGGGSRAPVELTFKGAMEALMQVSRQITATDNERKKARAATDNEREKARAALDAYRLDGAPGHGAGGGGSSAPVAPRVEGGDWRDGVAKNPSGYVDEVLKILGVYGQKSVFQAGGIVGNEKGTIRRIVKGGSTHPDERVSLVPEYGDVAVSGFNDPTLGAPDLSAAPASVGVGGGASAATAPAGAGGGGAVAVLIASPTAEQTALEDMIRRMPALTSLQTLAPSSIQAIAMHTKALFKGDLEEDNQADIIKALALLTVDKINAIGHVADVLFTSDMIWENRDSIIEAFSQFDAKEIYLKANAIQKNERILFTAAMEGADQTMIITAFAFVDAGQIPLRANAIHENAGKLFTDDMDGYDHSKIITAFAGVDVSEIHLRADAIDRNNEKLFKRMSLEGRVYLTCDLARLNAHQIQEVALQFKDGMNLIQRLAVIEK